MAQYALLVATASYSDGGLQELRSPVGDAQRLASVLRDPDIGGFDQVTVLQDRPRAEIEEAIEELFADRRSTDLTLLYISCHGVRDQWGRLYFATPQTRRSRLPTSAVSSGFVHDRVDQSQAGAKVLLLDCCYSGAFVAGFRPKSQRDSAGAAQLAGRGYVVITASDALEYAFERDGSLAWDEGSTSLFTDAVIAGLTDPDADIDGDGSISTADLFDYVFAEVRARGASQTPEHYADGVHGRILLARVDRCVPRLMAQPDKLDFGRLTQGQHAIGRVWVRNGGGGELDPVVKTSAAWLRARLDGEDVVVALDTTTPGVHRGQLTISSQGGDTTIPITARVDPGREKPVNSVSDTTQDSSQPPHGISSMRRETLDGIVMIFSFMAVAILIAAGQILRVLAHYESQGPPVPYGGLFVTLMVGCLSGAIVETAFFRRADSDKPVLTLTPGITGALLGTLLATDVLRLATLNDIFHLAIWLASVFGATTIFTLYFAGYFIFRAIRRRN